MYGSDDGVLAVGGERLFESIKRILLRWEEGLEAS
jgi:hypothetical protein